MKGGCIKNKNIFYTKTMKRKNILSLFVIATAIFTLSGCSSTEKITMSHDQSSAKESLLATNWFQTSGEAKALYIQGYNIATERLKDYLKKPHKKPYSIVLDLDETVIDNSPYEAENILRGRGFSHKTWDEWVNMKCAKAVPGAKEFLQFADKNGVKIFYISDRDDSQLEATMENLKAEGIPVQSRNNILLKSKKDKSGKVNRREFVKKHTTLIMLFGDNLSDFDVFSKNSIEERNNTVEKLKKEFGNKFILFPNPMYGAFESAIYNGKFPSKAQEKTQMRVNLLKSYKNLNN